MKARDVDILLGTPARLAIVASLMGAGSLTFTQLRQETGLADGNLHVQTRRLLDAGYLDAGKMQSGNRTLTCFRLTEAGETGYRRHVRLLAKPVAGSMYVMNANSAGRERGPGDTKPNKDDSQVW